MKRHLLLCAFFLCLCHLTAAQDSVDVKTASPLVKRLKILEERIADQQELSAALLDLCAARGNDITTSSRRSALLQTAPTPVGTATAIHYQLPPDAKCSTLYVCDHLGKQVAVFRELNAYGHVMIGANKLKHGIYYYSLMINGKLVDTKKLLVTK